MFCVSKGNHILVDFTAGSVGSVECRVAAGKFFFISLEINELILISWKIEFLLRRCKGAYVALQTTLLYPAAIYRVSIKQRPNFSFFTWLVFLN